jgi:hypothetical protein
MSFRPILQNCDASNVNEEVKIGDLIRVDTVLGGPPRSHVYLITQIDKDDKNISWHALHDGKVVTFSFSDRTINTGAIVSRLS